MDNLNDVIAIYLGGESNKPGIQPGWSIDRIKKVYPEEWQSLYSQIEPILKLIDGIDIDWKKEDLAGATETVKTNLEQRFPDLSEAIKGKLLSYFAYQWR